MNKRFSRDHLADLGVPERLRKAMPGTIEKLSQDSGIHVNTIGKILNGKGGSTEQTLDFLASNCGITIKQLLTPKPNGRPIEETVEVDSLRVTFEITLPMRRALEKLLRTGLYGAEGLDGVALRLLQRKLESMLEEGKLTMEDLQLSA